MIADLLYSIGRLVGRIAEEVCVQALYVALQCSGNDAEAPLAHAPLAPGFRESGGAADMIAGYVGGHIEHVLHIHAGGQLRQYHADQRLQCGKVRLLHLLKGKLNHLPLSLGPHIIGIHQTESSVGHGLDTVQVLHAAGLQLRRGNSRRIHRLGDEGVHIIEFLLGKLHVDAAENIDPVGDGFPVKGGIVLDLQVQVPVQRLYRIIRSAQHVGGIDLVVIVVPDVHVGIPVHGHQIDLSGIVIDIHQDIDVGIVALAQGIVPAVHAEHRHGPESL